MKAATSVKSGGGAPVEWCSSHRCKRAVAMVNDDYETHSLSASIVFV